MELPTELRRVLCDARLLETRPGEERPRKAPHSDPASTDPMVEPLSGGVSSEVLMVHTTPTPVCAKRALPQLRVAGTWEAPVERSTSEARWLEAAGRLAPGLAPPLLAQGQGWLVLPYLPPERWTMWKTMLLAGQGDAVVVARQLGTSLGRLHERAASEPDLARQFDTTEEFTSLRLAPYLRTLAARHPQHADAQGRIEVSLLANRRTLVHGDVSPKNVLVDADGTPVLIDAECAWWGDAAFDLAFCLNHLLLKQLVVADVAPVRRAARVLVDAYLGEVGFEPLAAISTRTADLLPWLLLARVDGMSPVEYLDEARRQLVRRTALRLLDEGVGHQDLGGLLSTVEEAFHV